MDQARFDHLARFLAAGDSRRGMVRTLGGTALGGLLAAVGVSEAGARKKNKKRNKGKGKCPPPNRCGKGKNTQCCTSSELCDNNACTPCGGRAGQPCCAGHSCAAPLVCNQQQRCEATTSPTPPAPTCGGSNQNCCAGSTPCGPGLGCTRGTCTVCGDRAGQPCCLKDACSAPLVCNQQGTCETPPPPCGELGQDCCVGSTPCGSGLVCAGDICEIDTRTVSLSFESFDQYHTHCWITVQVTGFAEGSYDGIVSNQPFTVTVDAAGVGSWTSRTINTIWGVGGSIEATVAGISSGLTDLIC